MGVERLNWMQRYAAEEIIEHEREGRLTRREMFGQVVAICGSASLATALLSACASDSSTTSTTAANSTRTSAGTNATTASASNTTAGGATTAAATTASQAATTIGQPPPSAGATPASTAAGPVPPTNTDGGARLSVKADDPAVKGGDVTFPGPAGTMLGYLARPAASGSRPGIIVIHEIFGLSDHIRDVARRLAKVGYVAVAPDLASRAGGTAKAANVGAALTQGSVADRVADLDSGLAYLEAQSDYNGKLGVVGFCFGGGMTLSYAAAQPKVLAATPYYGPTPQPASTMSATKAAILAHYGANDARVNAGIAALEEALAGKTFEKKIYDGAGHAFNNDTGGAYNEQAAVAAWTSTLAWFAKYLA